jgi:polyisoprenoid-binding protein YceI
MRKNRYVHSVLSVIASMCLVGVVLAADTYVTDPSHTLVGFTVRHMVINKVRGKFNEFQGIIVYDENDITKSSLRGSINVASIDTDNEKRDKHLRSPDFFDAEGHPQITFASKWVEKRGDEHVLIGDLTMRGTTREVEIPFTITGKITDPWGQSRIGFEAALELNRKDYGVAYHKVMDNGGLVVGDTVKIELMGEAIKQSS